MRFYILKESNKHYFEKQLKRLVEEGWMLVGDHQYSGFSGSYTQLLRHEDSDAKPERNYMAVFK